MGDEDKRTDHQPKAIEVFKINETFKATTPQYVELIKLIGKYQQTVETLAQIGGEVSELLKNIGKTNDSTLGEGIQSIGDAFSIIEINRKTKLTEVGVEMFNSELTLDQRSKEMAILERDFKKKNSEGYSQIKKLRKQKQKFHKGTTRGKAKQQAKAEEGLEKTTKLLDEKIEEMDKYETEKLQEIIMIDRKRYTALIGLMVKSMQHLAEHSETTLNSLRQNEKGWSDLCGAAEQIPERLQKLISSGSVISSGSPPPSPRASEEKDRSNTTSSASKKEDKEKRKKEKEQAKKEKEERKKKDKGKKEEAPAQKVQGLYQWVPRAADELAIEIGQEVTLVEEVNEEWWLCSNGEKQGLIPSNYVKKI